MESMNDVNIESETGEGKEFSSQVQVKKGRKKTASREKGFGEQA